MQNGPSLEYWYLGTFLLLVILQYQASWRQAAGCALANARKKLRRAAFKLQCRLRRRARTARAKLPDARSIARGAALPARVAARMLIWCLRLALRTFQTRTPAVGVETVVPAMNPVAATVELAVAPPESGATETPVVSLAAIAAPVSDQAAGHAPATAVPEPVALEIAAIFAPPAIAPMVIAPVSMAPAAEAMNVEVAAAEIAGIAESAVAEIAAQPVGPPGISHRQPRPSFTARLRPAFGRLKELAARARTLPAHALAGRIVAAISTDAPVAVTLQADNDDRLQERMIKVAGFVPAAPPPETAAEASIDQAALAALPEAPRPFKATADLLQWLPGRSDPDLWHELVGSLDFDSTESLRVVEWILGRPHCDRATAALALIKLAPADLMHLASAQECEGLDRDRWTIARLICERSQAGTYLFADFDLRSVGVDTDPSALLETLRLKAAALSDEGKTVPWPLPEKLLSQRYEGREAYSPSYAVTDGALWIRQERAAA